MRTPIRPTVRRFVLFTTTTSCTAVSRSRWSSPIRWNWPDMQGRWCASNMSSRSTRPTCKPCSTLPMTRLPNCRRRVAISKANWPALRWAWTWPTARPANTTTRWSRMRRPSCIRPMAACRFTTRRKARKTVRTTCTRSSAWKRTRSVYWPPLSVVPLVPVCVRNINCRWRWWLHCTSSAPCAWRWRGSRCSPSVIARGPFSVCVWARLPTVVCWRSVMRPSGRLRVSRTSASTL